jgi:hypothetical protein
MMLLIVRLWGTMAVRSWRDQALQLLTAGVVLLALGYHLLSAPRGSGGEYLSGLLGGSLVTALFFPVILRSADVLSSARFRILPVTPKTFFLLQLLLGNPLRTLLTAIVLCWGVVGLVIGRASAVVLAAEIVQLMAGMLTGVMAVQTAESLCRRFAPGFFYLLSLFLGWMGFQVVLFYGDAYADLAIHGLAASADNPRAWLLLGEGGTASAEILLALALLGACVAAVRLAWSVVERGDRPTSPSRVPRLGRAVSWLAAGVSPGSPASFGKELALALRLSGSRALLSIAFGTAVFAFLAEVPLFLPVGFLGLVTLSHNLLGADLPLGGDLRYRLLPGSVRGLFWRRHAALALVALVCVVGAAALVAGVTGRGFHLLTGVIALAFGMSLFAVSTVPGDRVSIRAPKALGLRAVFLEGGFVATAAWVSILVLYSAVLAVLTGAGYLLRALAPAAPHRVADDFSTGMRKRLALACAVVHSPALLVLDEPFESLDPLMVRRLKDLLTRCRSAGGSVLLSSHLIDAIEQIADRIVILERGRVVVAGSAQVALAQAASRLPNATLEELYLSVVEEKAAPPLGWLAP